MLGKRASLPCAGPNLKFNQGETPLPPQIPGNSLDVFPHPVSGGRIDLLHRKNGPVFKDQVLQPFFRIGRPGKVALQKAGRLALPVEEDRFQDFTGALIYGSGTG